MCLACRTGFVYYVVKKIDTGGKSTEERIFFFLYDATHKHFLCTKFGIRISHFVYECGQELIYECFFLFEESICVSYGAAQYTSYHITGFCIVGQLSVGNRESNGANMICHNAHSNIGLFVNAIFLAAKFRNLLYYRLENVGVVIGILSLKHTTKTLKSHAGVNNSGGQRLE